MIQKIEHVTIAGSGNVATHLAKALVKAGIKIEKYTAATWNMLLIWRMY